MKLDKRNPRHVLVLVLSILASLFAVLVYWVFRLAPAKRKYIIFYGHALNGNLKSFYDFLLASGGFEPFFLSLSKEYIERLVSRGEGRANLLYGLSLRDMYRVGRSRAVITSHGLYFFKLINLLTGIKFVDVWHGIPYKGFDAKDFSHLHSRDQVWVSSQGLKEMYVDKFGFNADRVKVTGYARVDQLVNSSITKSKIIEKYNLKRVKKHILIAPTWAQDDRGRSLLPFNTKERIFFKELDEIARKHDALLIFRTHLNSNESVDVGRLTNTVFMPYAKYEIAEEFLYISDMLVTDWSSIAFDFLPLDRPTIFLDVKAPFKKGFSLGPEYRFGEVVNSFDRLKSAIDHYLKRPDIYLSKHRKSIAHAKDVAYGSTLDGESSRRYHKELNELLG